MESEIKLSAIEVQKELMKNKVIAKFGHYCHGNLFYTVELESGKYQLPISIVDTGKLSEIIGSCETGDENQGGFISVNGLYTSEEVRKYGLAFANFEINRETAVESLAEVKMTRLSEDLGTTTFSAEIKGSELNRWIKKAIERDEFIKIG